ncbi:hypothetical protein [Cohnella yongneupensis]|uniref:Response regulatory domain-containing protein n=1 Tax=Cohnella yongneupensis TaxID=425006 RepID=A0ABW0QX39_9BACL
MDPVLLLIADDHSFYREGVRTMLQRVPDMEVIGESSDGIEATQRILQTSSSIQVLVVTCRASQEKDKLTKTTMTNVKCLVFMD